ncbi:hypothetical protein [Pseudomonas aeruginosa]|uniref:hypothetical protein n=1 Tax=Pseudomonas aeruginosa TaxID=287 RepID=UPI00068E2ACF|nr:hypothetical protein [Pseudomonas aeruginosa]
MSNCPHEAWDFGALQCPDCGAVKDHVTDAEHAKLAAEAQALREEVERCNRITVAMSLDISAVGEALGIPGEEQEGGTGEFIDLIRELQKEVQSLRARVVVVPERKSWQSTIPDLHRNRGWNACLDELARLNGKTVSEWLLRQLLDSDGIDGIFDAQQNYAAHQELRALLNQDKENGNG